MKPVTFLQILSFAIVRWCWQPKDKGRMLIARCCRNGFLLIVACHPDMNGLYILTTFSVCFCPLIFATKKYNPEALDKLITGSGKILADGGAAMTAYAKMQFTQMGKNEREHYIHALLRYCELDTLAMVMIWEGWNDMIKKSKKQKDIKKFI